MYVLTSGKCLRTQRIQRNSWFHVEVDSDPEVGCCHGVSWTRTGSRGAASCSDGKSMQELEFEDLRVGFWTSEM